MMAGDDAFAPLSSDEDLELWSPPPLDNFKYIWRGRKNGVKVCRG